MFNIKQNNYKFLVRFLDVDFICFTFAQLFDLKILRIFFCLIFVCSYVFVFFTSIIYRSKSIPVINITQGHIKKITWREMIEIIKVCYYKYPFMGRVCYSDVEIRSSRFIHNFFVLFFQIIPAYFIDFLMLIFQQKRL